MKKDEIPKTFCLVVAAMTAATLFAGISADFTTDTGRINRELHSSGYAPRVTSQGSTAKDIKALNFAYTRTHDLALVSSGQRIIDTHFIFPLMNRDPRDSKNYYFDARRYGYDVRRQEEGRQGRLASGDRLQGHGG